MIQSQSQVGGEPLGSVFFFPKFIFRSSVCFPATDARRAGYDGQILRKSYLTKKELLL